MMRVTEIIFFDALCVWLRMSLGVKKPNAKIGSMQSYGQVLPPCDCIAGIAVGQYIYANSLPDQRGGGGGHQQNWQGSAPPSPKLVFLFLGLVLESGVSSLKKKKRSVTARPQLRLW
jgi:hypothetical protein